MKFTEWLQLELEKRNWNREDLAKRSGITSSALSLIYSGKRKPGAQLCRGIAKAFKFPPEVVYRQAGLLPIEIENPPNFDELKYWFNQMTEDEQEAFLAQGRVVIEIRNRRSKEKRQQSDPEIG